MKKQLRNLTLATAAMMMAGSAFAQTAVTPGAGTANPFAYALSSSVQESVVTVNYSLNTDATAVTLVVKNQDGDAVITQNLSGITKGAHTATFDLAGQETSCYTWEIKVTGAAKTAVEEFHAVNWNHPRGVDVDNNMESPAFGNIYVTEGRSSTNTKYYSCASTGGGNGLYIFTPDMQGVKNKATGLYAFMGGLTVDQKVATGTSTSGADLARVRVAEDGRIFVTRLNDSGSYICVVKDAATLIANNKFTSILGDGSVDASTYAFNNTAGNFVAGPNVGFDIKGSGENLKMVTLAGLLPLWNANVAGGRTDEYALGNANTLPTPSAVTSLTGTHTVFPQSTNVCYDNRGGIWWCQYRTTASNKEPALIYIDANGQQKYFEGDGATPRGGGGIRFNPDFTQIAICSSLTTFTIYDITYADDNTPTLTPNTIVTHGMGKNINDIAWDLAGNLYMASNGGEKFKGFSIPRANNDFTTKAAAQYAICYTAPVVIDPLYAAGAFQGWDPANAAEFTYENGVYVLDLEVGDTEREFKISTAKGDWDTFNAGALSLVEGETWTTQYLTKDAPATLYAGKDNIGLPWAGTWTVTVDLTANTIVATTETPEPTPSYPENIYAIGNVGGYGWSTSDGIALAHEGDGVYKAQVSVDDSGNGNGYFQFATTLGDNWDAVNSGTRYGALNADEAIVIDAVTSMTNNWGGGTQSWMIAPGEYVMVVDIVNCTVTVSNIADGIESIESENIVAPAVYYNLQGVKVENPAEGNVYIKVVNGKATKVVK